MGILFQCQSTVTVRGRLYLSRCCTKPAHCLDWCRLAAECCLFLVTSHLQVVPEEEDYADQYEWAPTGGKSHTFHIRPPILLHNLLPYPVNIAYEVSALSLLWCMRWNTLSLLWCKRSSTLSLLWCVKWSTLSLLWCMRWSTLSLLWCMKWSTLSLLWCMRSSTLSLIWSFFCMSLCVSVCMGDGMYVYVGVYYSYYI